MKSQRRRVAGLATLLAGAADMTELRKLEARGRMVVLIFAGGATAYLAGRYLKLADLSERRRTPRAR